MGAEKTKEEKAAETNKEWWLRQLLQLDDDRLAMILCGLYPNCEDCPAIKECRLKKRAGVVEWLNQVHKN